jgi:hypothetical protein
VTQQFVAEASLLARKWQDKIKSFQEVRKQALKLEKEKEQAKYESKAEKEDKGKQHALLEAAK